MRFCCNLRTFGMAGGVLMLTPILFAGLTAVASTQVFSLEAETVRSAQLSGGPASTYKKMMKLSAGTKVSVTACIRGLYWCKVKVHQKDVVKEGWLEGRNLRDATAGSGGQVLADKGEKKVGVEIITPTKRRALRYKDEGRDERAILQQRLNALRQESADQLKRNQARDLADRYERQARDRAQRKAVEDAFRQSRERAEEYRRRVEEERRLQGLPVRK